MASGYAVWGPILAEIVPGANIVCPGVSVTGQVPRFNPWEDVGGDLHLERSCLRPDPLLDDQSLWVETKQGVSVILGCAHAGVMNTLRCIAGLTQVESFHLLLDCTGEDVIKRFNQAFESQYSACHVGQKFHIMWSSTCGKSRTEVISKMKGQF